MTTKGLRGCDLLSMTDLSPVQVQSLLDRSLFLKKGGKPTPLQGKTLALLFEKPSMRTRVSFDTAMYEMGGHPLYLGPQEVGLSVRESISSVGHVLSRYVAAIACRTFAQATLEELARAASVPVINALSDQEHPCQALADLLTVLEIKGRLRGIVIAFIGDGNNVAASLALGAAAVGASLRVASPPGYDLPEAVVRKARDIGRQTGGQLQLLVKPAEAVEAADVVYTDVWTSMGQEHEAATRRKVFASYQVTPGLLAQAKRDSIFMHPLPAHEGEDVSAGFLDHPQSVVYQQAENRLHTQKALLEALLGD
ncbi:MAG: ornithine carbamoyltransferase [Chloroflexi bacterium]|nr:ornithine carbamoyltransferase [Chloroflexota bacterium]